MAIKNIIFDLGGVIINIDYKKTIRAFNRLGTFNFEDLYTQHRQNSLFDDFETGKVSEIEFRNQLRNKLDLPLKDEEINTAWNAMLLDLPIKRLQFIKSLRAEYKVCLFSNTNSIHLRKVYEISFNETGFDNFDSFFDKQYYSHLFGHRKPNGEAFTKLLNENSFKPNETLFIDDSAQHINGAKEAGLHTFLLSSDKKITDVLSFINEINAQCEPLDLNFKMVNNY